MDIILRVIFFIISFLVFEFVLWKRLKEDYTPENIFTVGLVSLFGLILTIIIAIYFNVALWFWLCFAGILTGLIVGVRLRKFKFFETVNAYVQALILPMGIFYIGDYFLSKNLFSLFVFIWFILLFILFLAIDRNYRSFSWYKSGRIGFSGIFIVGIFFFVRGIVALSGIPVISLSGKIDAIFSFLLSACSFLVLYYLAIKRI